MRALRFAFVLLSLAIPLHAQARPACIDPATPLRTLVAKYDRWPDMPPGNRAHDARALLDIYLRTGDDTDYHKALLSYENLEADFPSNRAVRLSLGLLYASGPDLNYRGGDGYRHVSVLNFSNADTRAARQLGRVLREDSAQWITAIAMTRIALVSFETKRIVEARAMIDRALRADPASVPLNLAWSDLLNREQRYADALDHIESHDAGCRVQAVAHAEALMLTGDTAKGSRLYLQTLANARPDETDRFYDDVRVMMTLGQIESYRALPGADRPKWLHAYWDRTAAASGRTVETRVAEQTVRAMYADTHYRAVFVAEDTGKLLMVISDTSHIVPWDAAGVLYVRHGPPDFNYHSDEGLIEQTGWVYASMQPPVIVLMARHKFPPSNWKPLLTPPCTDGFLGRFNPREADERLASGQLLRSLRDVYYALSAFDPRYGELVGECMFVAMGMKRIRYDEIVVQFRYDNRKILPKLAHSESSLPHFTKPVRIATAAYQFRGVDLTPEVVAISSIPIADLRDNISAAQRLRITYSVTDTLIDSFRTDTVVALPPDATTGLVRAPVLWKSPSITNGTMRVTVTDPDDTLRGATKSIAFNVRENRDAVAISDIVVADIGVQGPLVRGAVRLSPLPDHTVQPGDAFRVFFELYGVKEDEQVNTTIVVHRDDQKSIREQLRLAGKRQDRTVAFDDRIHLDARGVAMRDVEIAGDLIPGHYAVDVTIKTASGVIAKRSGVVIVEAPK